MGPKINHRAILLLSTSQQLKYPTWVVKKGTFGSPMSIKEASCGVLGCYRIYKKLPIPGTMYKICTYGQRHRLIMYINIYVQHGLGWTVTSHSVFLGSVTIYNFLQA